MEVTSYCLFIMTAGLIFAGKNLTSAEKEKMVVFPSPFFSSLFQESKERLETKHIFETKVDGCSNPKTDETTTEETPTVFSESSSGGAVTTRENELATTTGEETKPCDHTTVPTTKTAEKPAGEGGTAAATTTSQIETTTISTTEEDTASAGRMPSSKLPMTTHDADVTSFATTTTQSTTVQSCDSADWTSWNNSCYKLFGVERSSKEKWYDAKQECESNNAHLVVIECDEEYNFITETLPSNLSLGTWIGLKRDGSTWEWHGSTGTIPADATMQPGCSSSNKCIAITKDDINRWQCSTCNDVKPFMCEVGK